MEKEKKVKTVILKPNEEPYVSVVNNQLETYQRIVGGYIDVVALDEDIDIIINDEGKLLGQKPNLAHPMFSEEWKDIIVGNVVFVSHNDEGEFVSLNRHQISKVYEFIEKSRYTLLKYAFEQAKKRFEQRKDA